MIEGKILKAIEELGRRFDGLDAKIDGVESRLNARIDGVENRLNARMDGVANDVKEIKQKVEAINEQTAFLTEFRTEANQRLEKLENSVEVLRQEDFRLKVEMTEIKKKIAG